LQANANLGTTNWSIVTNLSSIVGDQGQVQIRATAPLYDTPIAPQPMSDKPKSSCMALPKFGGQASKRTHIIMR
jgi:hypothetical protein